MARHSTKLALAVVFSSLVFGQQDMTIPAGAKIYIAPMHGFETHLAAAMIKEKVPVVVVSPREQADFEITGTAKEQRNLAWRAAPLSHHGSQEHASIHVVNIKTGVVVFAYVRGGGQCALPQVQHEAGDAVHKPSSRTESPAEAFAKFLKNKIEKSQ